MAADQSHDAGMEDSITVEPHKPSPSSFTAVNGHSSAVHQPQPVVTVVPPATTTAPTTAAAVVAAAATAAAVAAPAPEPHKPAALSLDAQASNTNGISDQKSQPASLTTSPSLVDSASTGPRQEDSPVSPQSVVTEPMGRKRSYEGAFGAHAEEARKQRETEQQEEKEREASQQSQPPRTQNSDQQHAEQVSKPPQQAPQQRAPAPTAAHALLPEQPAMQTEKPPQKSTPQPTLQTRDLPPETPQEAERPRDSKWDSTTSASVGSGRQISPTTARQQPLSSEYDPLARSEPDQSYYDGQDDHMSDGGNTENGDDSKDPGYGSPDRDEQRSNAFGEYSRTSAVQVDPEARNKRRKRVFSNRTKTGCMTCRKRKKKCDEMHPECNNCLRGGFVCEGYSVRNQWQKPTQTKAPVLQSKPTTPYTTAPSPHYPPHPASAGPPQPPHHRGSDSHEYGAPPPPSAPHHTHPGAGKPDLKSMEDGRRDSRITPPSDSRGQASPWSAHPYPPPQAHASPRYAERGIPPPHPSSHHHEPVPLSAHEDTHAQQHYSMPPVQHAAHHASAALGHGPPPPHGAPVLPPAPSALARRPSSADAGAMPRSNERDKMLRGEYYLPYTPALMADREQCAAAAFRFNNAGNPAMGFRHDDRMRLFAEVVGLRPTPDPREAPLEVVPQGSVGPGTIVEAPFNCDYGYNISIGRDVIIGPECRINDTCQVVIGDNVVFSPGVRLICGTYAIDPKERKKGKGRALGRNIVIEDDAWLGAGVTILPGVRVGRCSTVGAGSLLHKDVPPYTVVAGNPPKVIRGIYDETTR